VLLRVLVKQLLAPLLSLTTGCMGFVVPPVKLSGGVGPVAGHVERGVADLEPTSVTTLRAGFHPLSLMREAPANALDAGVGYGGDLVLGHAPPTFNRRATVHGPYVEGAYYPLRVRAGSATVRLGVRANADLLFHQPSGARGYGSTLVTELEIGGYSSGGLSGDDDGDGDGDAVLGTVLGSWSLGAFAGGSLRSFPRSHYAGLTAGLSVRVPLIAGVVCCGWPSGDDDDDDDGATSSNGSWHLPKRRHRTRRATPVHSSPPASRPERIPTPERNELKRR
jgi:hypothetical protein